MAAVVEKFRGASKTSEDPLPLSLIDFDMSRLGPGNPSQICVDQIERITQDSGKDCRSLFLDDRTRSATSKQSKVLQCLTHREAS